MIELIRGDCLEEMKKIPDGSIDLVLTDPPYGTTACKWDTVIPFEPMWEQLKRVIKPNGAIVLFGSQPFTSALVMSNVKMFKYEWIWEAHKGKNPMLAKIQPMKIHESVLVFGEGKIIYNPQMTSGKPYKQRGEHNKLKSHNIYAAGRAVGYAKDFDSSKRYPVTKLYFSNHNQKGNSFHPTQKPVALMEYLIKTYTNDDETVLDFTMGSGTTGVACKNLNRNFIGIELDKEYYEIAKERIMEKLI
jgi:site-specific DNA-methyltransferase (adenine-specific)